MKMTMGLPGPRGKFLRVNRLRASARGVHSGTAGLHGPAILSSKFSRDGINWHGSRICPAVPSIPRDSIGDARSPGLPQAVVLILRHQELAANTPHNTRGTHMGHTAYTQETHGRTHAQKRFASAPEAVVALRLQVHYRKRVVLTRPRSPIHQIVVETL